MTALATVTNRDGSGRAQNIRLSLSLAIDPALIRAGRTTAESILQRARNTFRPGRCNMGGGSYTIESFYVSHTEVAPANARNHQTILTLCPSSSGHTRSGVCSSLIGMEICRGSGSRFTGCFRDRVAGAAMDVCYYCFCDPRFDPMRKLEHEIGHALGMRHTYSESSPTFNGSGGNAENSRLNQSNVRDIFLQLHREGGSSNHLRVGVSAIQHGYYTDGMAVTPRSGPA